jgi:hypothetical protein
MTQDPFRKSGDRQGAVRDYRLARVERMLNPSFGTVYATLHCPLVESGLWCPGFRGAGHGDPDQDTEIAGGL